MKKLPLLSVCFSIHLFSIPVFAQIISEDNTAIIKTNVLIIKDVQQWALSIETKTRKLTQTNNFTVGYNQFSDGRKGVYMGYGRRFYFSSELNYLNFFVSPYGKIIYRDVNSDGVWLFSGPRFESTSIVAGGNLGFQSIIFKKISVECLMGIGLGAVLWKREYSGEALPIHLDGQLVINLGYRF